MIHFQLQKHENTQEKEKGKKRKRYFDVQTIYVQTDFLITWLRPSAS